MSKTEAIYDLFEFRSIDPSNPDEIEEAARIEQICFPPHEACEPGRIRERVGVAADIFLVAIDKKSGKMAGFLNGLATDESVFRDEFFLDAKLHNPDGANIMILGLDVLPEYRHMGLATSIVELYVKREKAKNRKSFILTCHDSLVGMYEKMGFVDLGISGSTWGSETWHEMSRSI